MQIVIAAIVVVVLGAGTYVFMQSNQAEELPTPVTESRQEDVAKNDTEVEIEEDEEPADIPLGNPSNTPTAPAADTAAQPVATPEPEPVAPITTEPEPVVAEPEPEPESEPVITSDYADGTYTASASYRSPGGTHSADISITLVNDTVTAATFSSDAKNSTSKKYVERFEEAFDDEVIGADLDAISLSRVGGASLTTGGYNDALALAKSQAAN